MTIHLFFIPGLLNEHNQFVAGQFVSGEENNNGNGEPVFVRGQVVHTPKGAKFVEGETIDTPDGIKFVAG